MSARHPAGGGVPPGGKTISFSAEKETVLHPKEKVEAGLCKVWGGKRRLASLRTVVRTPPGRYGHPMVEQGKDGGSIFGPPGCATLAAECGNAPGSSHSTQISLSAAREAPDHPGPERGTRRRRVVRASACPCSPRAGRNGREGSPMSYESRQPPFSTRNPP